MRWAQVARNGSQPSIADTQEPKSSLSEAESNFLQHMTRWGSDGYPIRKVGKRHWIWEECLGVSGPLTVFHTKGAAYEAIERYLDVLAGKEGRTLVTRSIANPVGSVHKGLHSYSWNRFFPSPGTLLRESSRPSVY